MVSFTEQIHSFRRRHLADFASPVFSAQTAAKILAYGAPIGSVLEHHPRLDRCQNRLQELMTEAEANGNVLAAGTVVLADRLSHALGRFERNWYAPKGGIWLTAAWPDVLLPEISRLLPFAVGLACCRTVRSYYRVDAQLKWVNDVLVEGKKIAGVLCTTVERAGGDRYHLLGIGLNCNNQDFPPPLQGVATSLAGELGRKVDLAECIGRLLAELNWAMGLLHYDEELAMWEALACEDGRSSHILTAWQQLSDTVGKKVLYGFDVRKKPLYHAVVTSIDPCGGLVMELDDQSTITESSGEIVYCESIKDAKQ